MTKNGRRRLIASGVIPVVVLSALLWLYAGNQAPLRADEVETYLERIESQAQNPGGRHDIPALRRFLESDDGNPFYTVNLYDFHDHAQYREEGKAFRVSGEEAFERFSAVMLRLLASRSSHPIFGSHWADIASSGWDRIVIVRYRSRRDIAEIFASREFADASTHKWAALERNERMLVQGLHIPELHLPVILLMIGGSAWAFFSWTRPSQRPSIPPSGI